MNIKALTHYLTVDETSGQIDYQSSANKLVSELKEYQENVLSKRALVGGAVEAVFDKYPGSNINQAALLSFTLNELGATPSNSGELTNAFKEYIKANMGTREEGKIYGCKKGPNGGSFRWSDKSVEDTSDKPAENE